jgi:hypothetical protein
MALLQIRVQMVPKSVPWHFYATLCNWAVVVLKINHQKADTQPDATAPSAQPHSKVGHTEKQNVIRSGQAALFV